MPLAHVNYKDDSACAPSHRLRQTSVVGLSIMGIGTNPMMTIYDAFHHYVMVHRGANGQLLFDATIDVNGECHDLLWLIGQLWKCREPMPEELCLRLGLSIESSYARAAQSLSWQLKQGRMADTLKKKR